MQNIFNVCSGIAGAAAGIAACIALTPGLPISAAIVATSAILTMGASRAIRQPEEYSLDKNDDVDSDENVAYASIAGAFIGMVAGLPLAPIAQAPLYAAGGGALGLASPWLAKFMVHGTLGVAKDAYQAFQDYTNE